MSRAFANLDGLIQLSRKDGIDIRPPLLRVITDLFVQEKAHTREEVQQYAELCLRLLPVVDAKTRAAVIAKLTIFSGTPVWLLDQIRSLSAADLGYQNVAAQNFVRVAATSHERQSQSDVQSRVRTSSPLEALARTISATAGTPSIGESFLRAEPAKRQALLLHLQQSGAAGEPDWFANRAAAIERFEHAARAQDGRGFAIELQQSFALSARIATQIVHDEGGEPLLVIARSSGMHIDILLRILLLLNPAIGHSVDRVFALYRLYQHVGLQAASPIMTSWREDSRARPSARYQPLHADESPARRAWDSFRTATESRRETAATSRSIADLSGKRQGSS